MPSARSNLTAGKRAAEVHHDDNSLEQRHAKRSKTSERGTVRNVPIELRQEIYRCLLDDMIAAPEHPYSDFPGSDGHAQFKDYLSMRLVDRQTSDEVKDVWEKEYAARAVFYLQDAPALYRLHTMAERIPYIAQTARFCMRCRSDDPDFPGDRDRINEDILMLFEFQQGWEEHWVDEPGLLNHVLYSKDGWDAEAQGFQVIDHDACELGGELGITTYQEVLYPVIQRSIQTRGFSWLDESLDSDEDESGVLGCTFFEGRIRDVSFSSYRPNECAWNLIRHQWEVKQSNSATTGKDHDEYRQRLRDLAIREKEVPDRPQPPPGYEEHLRQVWGENWAEEAPPMFLPGHSFLADFSGGGHLEALDGSDESEGGEGSEEGDENGL